jgi:signal transduction histidine kinase
MCVGEIIRDATTDTIATLAKRHEATGRTRLLAESAENLLDRMEQLRSRESRDELAVRLERGAVCQWMVDLTYRIVKCDYVGVAQIRDQSHTPEPLAEAGRSTPKRGEWWGLVQSALRSECGNHEVGDARLIGAPLLLRFPRRHAAHAGLAHQQRAVYVIPMRIAGELVSIFAVESQRSAPPLTDEVLSLVRGMANTAAITLEAVAARPTPESREMNDLRSALAEMDGALSLVSHELKSPLTTIMGCLQLIRPQIDRLARMDPSASEVEKTLATVHERLAMASRSAEIEARLATDLVDASRLRSGRMTLCPSPCELGHLIREAVGSQRAASRRIIHLEVPDRSIPVSADPHRIVQVVTNFLANALKYSPKATPVEVRVEIAKSCARVSVSDYGPGLEAPELKRVWRRFYRVSGVPVHNATGSGLGLGLYIAREVIRGHRGKVGVTSVPGHGATFWFSLPLATAA